MSARINKFDVADEYREGSIAFLSGHGLAEGKSLHWQAGFDSMRQIKNTIWYERLNEYLRSIGCEPMHIFHIQGGET